MVSQLFWGLLTIEGKAIFELKPCQRTLSDLIYLITFDFDTLNLDLLIFVNIFDFTILIYYLILLMIELKSIVVRTNLNTVQLKV